MLNFKIIYGFVIEATTVVWTDVLVRHNTKVNARISVLSFYVNIACCFNVGYIIARCLFVFFCFLLSYAQFCVGDFCAVCYIQNTVNFPCFQRDVFANDVTLLRLMFQCNMFV